MWRFRGHGGCALRSNVHIGTWLPQYMICNTVTEAWKHKGWEKEGNVGGKLYTRIKGGGRQREGETGGERGKERKGKGGEGGKGAHEVKYRIWEYYSKETMVTTVIQDPGGGVHQRSHDRCQRNASEGKMVQESTM